VVTVQRAMEHRKVTTTFNTYSQLRPTAEDRTRAGAAAMAEEVENPADCLRTNEGSSRPDLRFCVVLHVEAELDLLTVRRYQGLDRPETTVCRTDEH
jgi:hypothetical protein